MPRRIQTDAKSDEKAPGPTAKANATPTARVSKRKSAAAGRAASEGQYCLSFQPSQSPQPPSNASVLKPSPEPLVGSDHVREPAATHPVQSGKGLAPSTVSLKLPRKVFFCVEPGCDYAFSGQVPSTQPCYISNSSFAKGPHKRSCGGSYCWLEVPSAPPNMNCTNRPPAPQQGQAWGVPSIGGHTRVATVSTPLTVIPQGIVGSLVFVI